jgi:hypothetical protein
MRRRGVAVLLVATTMLAVPSAAGAARSGVTIHHKDRFQFYGSCSVPTRTDALGFEASGCSSR